MLMGPSSSSSGSMDRHLKAAFCSKFWISFSLSRNLQYLSKTFPPYFSTIFCYTLSLMVTTIPTGSISKNSILKLKKHDFEIQKIRFWNPKNLILERDIPINLSTFQKTSFWNSKNTILKSWKLRPYFKI